MTMNAEDSDAFMQLAAHLEQVKFKDGYYHVQLPASDASSESNEYLVFFSPDQQNAAVVGPVTFSLIKNMWDRTHVSNAALLIAIVLWALVALAVGFQIAFKYDEFPGDIFLLALGIAIAGPAVMLTARNLIHQRSFMPPYKRLVAACAADVEFPEELLMALRTRRQERARKEWREVRNIVAGEAMAGLLGLAFDSKLAEGVAKGAIAVTENALRDTIESRTHQTKFGQPRSDSDTIEYGA